MRGTLTMRAAVSHLGTVTLIATVCLSQVGAQSQLPAIGRAAPAQATTPRVGEKAADFSLMSIDGPTVRLTEETKRGPVVLVVLRGWPGYQCPFCTRQFGEFLSRASDIEAGGARVLFVYPGPAEGLREHARAFTANRDLPPNFRFLTDPNYTFTNAYGLRWDAPNETSYPSTFVLDATGTVRFAQTSRTHGGRVPIADVLKALSTISR
jgi:peroxiredoxin Q/BCP